MIRTLVIDPDVGALKRTKAFLERDGEFIVDLAACAAEGREARGRKRYDAIVSGFDLPDEDGLSLLRSLREGGDNTPFVLFTVRSREDLMMEVLRRGNSSFIERGGSETLLLADLAHRLRQMVGRRRAEELRAILTESPMEGILILDFEGDILYANRATQDMIGAEGGMESLIGQSVFVFIAQEFHDALLDAQSSVREGESGVLGEYQLIRVAGDEIWVEALCRRISFQGEGANLLILRDITDRKRIELSLREANNKLNLLNSVTRHDILNQITAVYGYSDLMARRVEGDPETERYLAKLTEAARTIQRQIAFTRDYQDMGVCSPEWQDMAEVFARASASIVPPRLEVKVELDDLEVFADPLLEKALFNLLENSLRHGGGVRTISVSARFEEGTCLIVLEDDGEGVSDDDRPHVFKRGYGKNTGYGLFLAREILAITDIGIEECGVMGKGARFEMRVPAGHHRSTSSQRLGSRGQ